MSLIAKEGTLIYNKFKEFLSGLKKMKSKKEMISTMISMKPSTDSRRCQFAGKIVDVVENPFLPQ